MFLNIKANTSRYCKIQHNPLETLSKYFFEFEDKICVKGLRVEVMRVAYGVLDTVQDGLVVHKSRINVGKVWDTWSPVHQRFREICNAVIPCRPLALGATPTVSIMYLANCKSPLRQAVCKSCCSSGGWLVTVMLTESLPTPPLLSVTV